MPNAPDRLKMQDRTTRSTAKRASLKSASWMLAGAMTAATAFAVGPAAAAQDATTVAVLTTHLQNDHAEFEPTNDAEKARMEKITQIFKTKLEESGKFKFVDVKPDVQGRIDKDQKMGSCGGCEIRYGEELGAQQVAWIDVQKVSNLILNINVYMKDVKGDKMVFTKSVDIRGNTDETWEHSMKYLVKHYIVAPQPRA